MINTKLNRATETALHPLKPPTVSFAGEGVLTTEFEPRVKASKGVYLVTDFAMTGSRGHIEKRGRPGEKGAYRAYAYLSRDKALLAHFQRIGQGQRFITKYARTVTDI